MSDSMRLAIVQHGDYAEALDLMSRGEPEPYFGMRNSVQMIERLCRDKPHLILSLNAERRVVEREGGHLVGLPRPKLPDFLPTRLSTARWARQILSVLNDFGPTRLLWRGDDFDLGARVLGRPATAGVETLVALAAYMPRGENPYVEHSQRRMIEHLNGDNVRSVGNHRWPATQSLIDHGLDPRKAVAYDLSDGGPPRVPDDYPVKSAPTGRWRVVFLGKVAVDKGIDDAIDAAGILADRGHPIELVVIGDGPDLEAARARASHFAQGVVTFLGRVGNQEAFEALLGAAVVVVPSRHRFREGLPMSLTEALVARTPAVVSDHPVLVRAFREGEGVSFFPECKPEELANRLARLMSDAELYRDLSSSTSVAYRRVECDTTLEELVDRWFGELQAQA